MEFLIPPGSWWIIGKKLKQYRPSWDPAPLQSFTHTTLHHQASKEPLLLFLLLKLEWLNRVNTTDTISLKWWLICPPFQTWICWVELADAIFRILSCPAMLKGVAPPLRPSLSPTRALMSWLSLTLNCSCMRPQQAHSEWEEIIPLPSICRSILQDFLLK